MFDRYLFVDFCGAGENDHAQRSICVFGAIGEAEPEKLIPDNGRNFSRNGLRQRVVQELNEATEAHERVIVGFDHQYSWPPRLWQCAQLNGKSWREAVLALAHGEDGRPPLDIPRRYCRAFNEWAGAPVFWTRLPHIADAFRIGLVPPEEPDSARFRLTERCAPYPPYTVANQPAPADAVGGMGVGVVGGQTICGLFQLARLLELDNVAWWPFDGFDIRDEAYQGKHVCVEIYPAAIRPDDVPANDDNDALYSCLFAQDADLAGHLAEIMDLSALPGAVADRVKREGWILNMDPGTIPAHMLQGSE